MNDANPGASDADTSASSVEARLLILASSKKDGEIAARILGQHHVDCVVCDDIAMLMIELARGAGAILIAEEMMSAEALDRLSSFAAAQPQWSDLPIVILAYHGVNSPLLGTWTQRLGNTTLIERPIRMAALVSVVHSALRARARQYQMRTSQQRLQESEQRFKTLFEHHPDGILVRDLGGKLISANKAMELLTGYTLAELFESPPHSTFVPEDTPAVASHFADAAAGIPKSYRATLIRKNGTTIEVEGAYLPFVLDGQIAGIHGIARDVTQARNYERRIEHLATHDALTGLPNRHLLNDRLRQAIEQNRRHGGQTGVLFMDLNRFKQVNDSLGHEVGDLLLKEIAQRLRRTIREIDTVARLGGDEFVIVLEQVDSVEIMASVAQTILDGVAEPIHLAGHNLSVSTSIGGSVYPKDGQDAATLVKHADLAMYQAKELGSGSFRFYDTGMNVKMLERLLTENALQRAVAEDQLRVHYQPRICVTSGRIVGVEALVRWDHPEKGLIAPIDFIPLAEEIGMIAVIGAWVLRAACAQNHAWQRAGIAPIKMAVNLSAQQLRRALLEQTVADILRETGLKARYLELEITETGLMQDIETACRVLAALRESGVSISIDDFGTGYSSLSQIKRLPVDTLKIDKSFIRDIADDADDAAIVRATIAMAETMRLGVVAEGVTAPEQVRFLAQHGCTEMQGYLFGAPMPANEMEAMLLRQEMDGANLPAQVRLENWKLSS